MASGRVLLRREGREKEEEHALQAVVVVGGGGDFGRKEEGRGIRGIRRAGGSRSEEEACYSSLHGRSSRKGTRDRSWRGCVCVVAGGGSGPLARLRRTWSRIFETTSAAVMTATIFISPPQAGHKRGFTYQTKAINRAQADAR